MDGDKKLELSAAVGVAVVVAVVYWMLVGMDAFLYFFINRWWLFMANSFLVWPIIELLMGGFRGLRETWGSTVLVVIIGFAFVLIYMMLTGTTLYMTFERSLEYVLYALLISYFAGKVKQQIMEGIR